VLQSSSEEKASSRRYALCIGIGTYTNLLNRNLRYAIDDAVAIANRLEDPQRGNFAVQLLTKPTETTKAALEKAVEDLLSAPDRQAEDLTLLYFSCHGDVNHTDNTFCLLPSDANLQTDEAFKPTNLISISDLARWFSHARTHHIIVLLDVCHSGGAGVALQHFKLDLDAGPNYFIIGAARQDQVTTENSLLRHGMFTHCLLRAFEQPPTKDGWQTISQIHTFVSDEIPWFAKDQPTQIQSWSVTVDPNLPLLRNPCYPEMSPLPPLWNVPFRRNPFFTEQEHVVSQLATTLQNRQKAALTQPQAVSGLGGIGKTQLALEYAYRHRQNYHAILWGRADTREALISTFVAIAHLLDLPQKDEQDQLITVQAVKTWLAGRSQWLLVLDNADELAIVGEFIPPAFQGHLLLTTRAQVTGELARKFEVEAMRPEIGALLLLRRAGLIARDGTLERASPSDVAIAKELSAEMGGLPLALDQAGAYIEEMSCSLQDYQQLYQIRRAELLKERGGVWPDYPESVATTWSLAFQKVEQNNPAASDLLRLCAFLHPDAIPEEIITNGAEHLGLQLQTAASDPLALNKAITALRRYSLVKRDADAKVLNIHRLVQAVLQDTMDAKTKESWIQRAVQAVNTAFPHIEYSKWEQCQRLLPHALACEGHIERWSLTFSEEARLLTEAGDYLRQRGQYGEALPLLERALAIREQLGPNHPDVAITLNTLAVLYYDQGQYTEAEPLYKRALMIKEQALGPDHPDVAYILNNLAITLTDIGKYAASESLLQRALTIFEQKLGLNHPNVAAILNNLSSVYQAQGKYAEALSLLQRALAIKEEVLGPDHLDMSFSLNNLAEIYVAQGQYQEAEPLYLQALAIKEKALGPNHLDVALVLSNLAELYLAQERYQEAILLSQRALDIREQASKPDRPDPHLAISLNNLALLYQAQGQYQEAVPLLQRTLTIREQTLGPDHPDVAYSLNNLALLYQYQKQYTEVERLYQQALTILEQALVLQSHLSPKRW